MAAFFHKVFFQPLYNGLVFLIAWMPIHDVGLAIIILTILVRALLVPLTHRATVAQKKMRHINPEISKIKTDYAHDREEQNRRIMELYKHHGINPFSSCLVFIIQIPVILALYWVFRALGQSINPSELYGFIPHPASIHTLFLGLIDLAKPSIFLSLVAAAIQYIQISLSLPPLERAKAPSVDVKQDFSEALNAQMKYIFPVIVFLVSYRISAAIALYWTVTNLFSVVHELVVGRLIAKAE